MDTLHKIWWLWIPVGILLAQIVIELTLPQELNASMHSEGGPHEILQVIFALGGLVFATRCLLVSMKNPQPFLLFWLTCFLLGCIYIAGEELSWGQHIFNWPTPKFWAAINDQNETNLHNASSWLDQKPKLLLWIGVVSGGLVIPFLQKFKPSILPQQFNIIYPPAILGVAAAFTLLTKIIDKIQDNLDENLFTRASEVEEIYLFYFVMVYLVILHRRLLQQ